jgi:putative membrane protein
MEGKKNLSPRFISGNSKEKASILTIALFHVVGALGFLLAGIDTHFLSLVPWHLLLMAGIVIYNHDRLNVRFLTFVLITSCLGFLAEFIGVHTGWLFGNYNYGHTLGLKLFDVPVMIGVNWFLLIYSTGVIMQRSRVKNTFIRVLTGGAILTFLDVLIEPIAIHFDYWHWTFKAIPLTNYLCWFLLSALMLFIFELFKFKQQNKAAPTLLFMQFVFFLILGLVY